MMKNLNLNPQMVTPRETLILDLTSSSKVSFNPPLSGFIKLNFDGASKGKPVLASCEGIFCKVTHLR